MRLLRTRITNKLKELFPELRETIRPYYGADNAQDRSSSILADGILVCIVRGYKPFSDVGASWPFAVDFGLVITVKAASAMERDEIGWERATKVAEKVLNNCWGYAREIDITPAEITTIEKRDRRNPDGTFSGVSYWLVGFSHQCTPDVAIGIV